MKKGLCLFGFLALMGYPFFWWKNGIIISKLEPITFSNEKYPYYRKQISKRMNAKTHEMTEYQVVSGSWDYTDPSDVAVALVDLNDDHIPEILALIGSRYYTTGVGGIEFEIYSKTKGELKSIVAVEGRLNGKPHTFIETSVQTSRHIAKASHKTNGYHDLCWFMETLHPQHNRKYFLTWRDGNYHYGPSEKITEHERKLFNENI